MSTSHGAQRRIRHSRQEGFPRPVYQVKWDVCGLVYGGDCLRGIGQRDLVCIAEHMGRVLKVKVTVTGKGNRGDLRVLNPSNGDAARERLGEGGAHRERHQW